MSAIAGRVLPLPKGPYNPSETYDPMDYVFYNGSTYVCKLQSLGNLPTNTTYWQIWAQGTAAAVAGNYYGECASAANVQNKVVSVSADQNFILQKGAILGVKFTYTNTFSASALNHITLNVNSEGAYPIYFGDTEDPTGTNPVAFGKADFIHYYLYDGVHWIYIANSGVQTAKETPFSAPGFIATNAEDAIVEAAENGGLLPHVVVSVETGSTVTLTKGGTTITATETSAGVYEADIDSYGSWTVTATKSGATATDTLTVDTVKVYNVTLSYVPDGSTVTPTDVIQTWLACSQITDKSYTTLNEVLADSTTLAALMADNNAVNYLVRSTTWASGITGNALAMHHIGINNYCANTLLADSTWKNAIGGSTYIDNVLNDKNSYMTSADAPSGEVTWSDISTSYPTFEGWKAFGGGQWISTGAQSDHWLCYEFDAPKKIYGFSFGEHPEYYTLTGEIQAYINGAWETVYTISKNAPYRYEVHEFSNPVTSQKLKFIVHTFSGGDPNIGVSLSGFIYYGREDIPATITKKTFATATDAEINEMCKWSERGVIDLETDCGWAVGQEHTFTLGAIAATGTFNGITWNVANAQPQQTRTIVLTNKGGPELVSPVLNTDGTSRNYNAFAWDYKDCLDAKEKMNATATNTGSWGATVIREWFNSGLLQQMLLVLPKLCNLIKVITAKEYGGTVNEVTQDYMAPRAEKEVFGSKTYSNEAEANALTQITFYQTSANRIKNVLENPSEWFERSPEWANNHDNTFCVVYTNGTPVFALADVEYGIAPFGGLG